MAISKPMLGRSRSPVESETADDIAYSYRRHIGRYLRDLRDEAGLTQAEVAKHLGVVPTTVSSFELGRGAPSPERYDALAALFGVDRAEFGRFLLRYTNPWLYDMLFESREQQSTKAIPERIRRRGRYKA